MPRLNPVVLKSETCKYITYAVKELLSDLDINDVNENKVNRILLIIDQQERVLNSINKAV